MGSGAGSFLKVVLRNFDVLAGYVPFSFSNSASLLVSYFFWDIYIF